MAGPVAAGLAEELRAFRESLRRFLRAEVVGAALTPHELFGMLAGHGFVAMAVPERYGGAGVDDFGFNAVVTEELMQANLHALGVMVAAHNDVCVPLLVAGADHSRRDEWLDGLATGALICAWAPPGPAASWSERGDRWWLTGASAAVVNGASADIVITGAPAGPNGELVLAAFDASGEGVVQEPAADLVGPQRLDLGDLRFDGVEVSRSALLGPEAVPTLGRVLPVSVAVLALGGARAALELTLEYVKERHAFGQPIASFENTRFWLAEIAAEIAAVEALVERCTLDLGSGTLTAARAAAAKLCATELYMTAADRGLQLHGGYGYMLEYPIAHAFTAARFLRLHGGTDEAIKTEIAESLRL